MHTMTIDVLFDVTVVVIAGPLDTTEIHSSTTLELLINYLLNNLLFEAIWY